MATRDPRKHYGQRGNRLNDDVKARIVELASRPGATRNGVARELGVSPSSVSGVCARAGITFDRTSLQAANAARHIDLAARRSRIIDRIYGRVEHLQDRLEAAGFQTLLKGEYGAEYAAQLDFVPTADERNVADTISRYVASTGRLIDMDADRGVQDAKALLTGLGRALGIGADAP